MSTAATETNRVIDAVWRIESPKLIAGLTRIVRNISLAEELAHDALVVALDHWPREGVPRNPGAWLMQTAKRRAIDYFRRNKMVARKMEELGRDVEEDQEHGGIDPDEALDDDVGDDLLRLIFTSCHPVLSPEARVALTLRLLGGLTTDEIAHAYLVPEPTIAQRIVRAKKTIAEKQVPFEVPRGPERADRLQSVLDVIYLIFNEGYAATSGQSWLRADLQHEALRLGRVLAGLAPEEAEVHGLVALMELHASRNSARIAPDGTPVLLLEQNRARWDQMLIRRGLIALERSRKLGGVAGVFALQAQIAAHHAQARTAADTNWRMIAMTYDALATVAPSPIVELNRAVAHGFAFGPAAGLEIAATLDEALADYHLLPSVRGDFLVKLGRTSEARAEFLRAAEMTRNERERDLLLKRADDASSRGAGP